MLYWTVFEAGEFIKEDFGYVNELTIWIKDMYQCRGPLVLKRFGREDFIFSQLKFALSVGAKDAITTPDTACRGPLVLKRFGREDFSFSQLKFALSVGAKDAITTQDSACSG